MGKIQWTLVVAASGMLLSTMAFAGVAMPAATFSGVSDTRAGIGLRFEFGDNAAEIVGSVRHTWTDTNNRVTGALAEIAVPVITKRNHGPKIRAMGLFGSTSVQGLAGIGYDFANQQPLLGVGVQGPYVEGGANYLLNGEFHPYVGANIFGGVPQRDTIVPPPPPG